MKLSAAQIGQFQKHGYVAVPHFFSRREVAALQADVERLKRENKLRNVKTESDGKTHSNAKVNLQICPMSPHSDLIRALPFNTEVLDAVSSLIGERIVLHLDQCFLKPARNGAGTNWHQDNAYFKISDPMKGTAMWIAVHDATVANGTLNVIPDTVSEKFEHSRDPDSDHHIRCFPPEERAVPVELEAGGVVFFAYGTAHCTRGNSTDKDRAGVAFHFLHEDYAQDVLKAERGIRPYLTGPNATGGLKEYGVKVAGAWPQEVEAMLSKAQPVGAR